MKKKICLLILALFFMSPLWAANDAIRPSTTDLPYQAELPATDNEVALLDHLIDVTKQNLENQKQLRLLLVDYLKLHQQFQQNTQDKEVSYLLVTKSYDVLKKIKETHLTHSFNQEFMSELTFFANIAAKWKTTPQ